MMFISSVSFLAVPWLKTGVYMEIPVAWNCYQLHFWCCLKGWYLSSASVSLMGTGFKDDCKPAGNAGGKHLRCRQLLPRQHLRSLSPVNCNAFELVAGYGIAE